MAAIYIASSTSDLAIDHVTAGGDAAVILTVHGAITGVQGASDLISGGNVNLTSGGGVGATGPTIQLNVGQNAADQLNISAKGDVNIEQAQGNLALFAITTTGVVDITVDNGSVVNVNTNVRQDPRSLAEIEAGWGALELTDTTGAETKITGTLSEYQLSQEAQYNTYWTDAAMPMANGVLQLSAADRAYYTSVFTAQAAKNGITDPTAVATFVSNAIAAQEISITQQFNNLATIFGPNGTYQPGTANLYAPATASTVVATGVTLSGTGIAGNVSIVAQQSGTTGGLGTYRLSQTFAQAVANEVITASDWHDADRLHRGQHPDRDGRGRQNCIGEHRL